MTTGSDNVTDIKNWPNLIFKFLLSILGGAIFVVGSALIGEVKELNKTMSGFKETLSGLAKDYTYMVRDDAIRDERIKDLESEVEKLKEVNRNR